MKTKNPIFVFAIFLMVVFFIALSFWFFFFDPIAKAKILVTSILPHIGDSQLLDYHLMIFDKVTAFALFCLPLIIILFFFKRKQIKNLGEKHYFLALKLLFIFLALLVFVYSIATIFTPDDFENIILSGFIKVGLVPYSEFFFHSNPLLWYFLAPILSFVGEPNFLVWLVFRIAMFALSIAIIFFCYLIAKIVTDKETALISVILLAATSTVLYSIVEIRSDVPETLLGIVSIYCFLKYLENGHKKIFALAGFFSSISFLFSQKAFFLIFGFFAIILFLGSGIKKENQVGQKYYWKNSLFFLTGFFVPITIFIFCLVFSGSFYDYFLQNFALNFIGVSNSSPFINTSYFIVNWFVVLFSLVGMPYFLLAKKTELKIRIIAFFALAFFLSLFFFKWHGTQYFLPGLPLFSILAGLAFTRLLKKFSNLKKLALLFLIILLPLVYSISSIPIGYNLLQEAFDNAPFANNFDKQSSIVCYLNIPEKGKQLLDIFSFISGAKIRPHLHSFSCKGDLYSQFVVTADN